MQGLRAVWKPSLLLVTVGVVITAAVTSVAAAWILSLPLLTGLLLGSIVASTDAAATFRCSASRLRLRARVAAALDVESGSNDPMAILLTVGFLEMLAGQMEPGLGMLQLFVEQKGIGAVAGLGGGWAAARLMNGINLVNPGLYPVLAAACGLAAFGAAALLGGSGFLAIYLAGDRAGEQPHRFQERHVQIHGRPGLDRADHDVRGPGPLEYPSRTRPVAGPALILSAILILVARPLAVMPLLLPFRFTVREQSLISWVGLKGAVPIILATFPLMFGLPEGRLLFNVVFFVLLVSATLQGWTLPPLARWLGLQQPGPPTSPVALELLALRDLDAEIVEYVISPVSAVPGRRLSELRLPEGAIVALLSRDGQLIPPKGRTRLHSGDHLFVIARTSDRAALESVFATAQSTTEGAENRVR